MGESRFLILPQAIGELCFSMMPHVPRLQGHPLQTLQPENLDRILTPVTCKKVLESAGCSPPDVDKGAEHRSDGGSELFPRGVERMIFSKPSSVAVAFGVMLSLLAVPSAGQAGPFDCLFPSPIVNPAPCPATFTPTTVQRVSWMPAIANPAVCDPCAPQVTLAPETKRRWTYSRIPKTTFKPVTTCDPCTGCPVTSYRPETSYSLLPWLRRESYTIYKPVSTPLASYNPCVTNVCNSCGGGVSSGYASGTSGCSTCAPGATLSGSISSPGTSMRLQSDPGYPSGKTYSDEPESSQQDDYPSRQGERTGGDIQPRPDSAIPKNTSTEVPELNGPRGRTAVRPIQPTAQVRTVSWELGAAPASPSRPASKPKLDVSGWHAVTD